MEVPHFRGVPKLARASGMNRFGCGSCKPDLTAAVDPIFSMVPPSLWHIVNDINKLKEYECEYSHVNHP